MQILNAKEEDAGRYTCVATNEAGEKLKHYEVKVYGEIPASLKTCCIFLYKKRKVEYSVKLVIWQISVPA